ncbi:ubiquinol-cytochrome C reductase hinge protein [Babesia ovis]|uniref:Ubiquinol-cytochrome C reductase hinge protein n=1 Tax=Babesia ovis TaxID=5869 RepID=A0A9W5TB22_BABOV|nr:ubiquinol-cytochrome C reductase hinge protein [Babesia ovis]
MAYPYRPKFLFKYPDYIPPTDEQDAQVDPRDKLKPACQEKCKNFTKLYNECAERVRVRNEIYHQAAKEGRGLEVQPPGQCLGQHYDVVSCVDNCVAKDLFRYLV